MSLFFDIFRRFIRCLNSILAWTVICLQLQWMGLEAQMFQGRIHLVGNRGACGEQMHRVIAALLCNRDAWRELEEH